MYIHPGGNVSCPRGLPSPCRCCRRRRHPVGYNILPYTSKAIHYHSKYDIRTKKQGYVGRQSCLSSGLDLTLVFLYLKVLSIFVTAALSAPFPFVAAILIFASFCFSCAEASDAHAAQSHNMCSNSSPNHTAQLRTSSHNIQLRNKQLRAKAGTIAGKVVDAEGQVEGFMFG